MRHQHYAGLTCMKLRGNARTGIAEGVPDIEQTQAALIIDWRIRIGVRLVVSHKDRFATLLAGLGPQDAPVLVLGATQSLLQHLLLGLLAEHDYFLPGRNSS